MKMVAFRISKFRSIEDTGWVNINDMTAFIGKNESGKTNILKALHKFNSLNDFYEIEKDWPKNDRHNKKKNHIVCSIRYKLEKDDDDILNINVAKVDDLIEISKSFDNTFYLDIIKPNETVNFIRLFDGFFNVETIKNLIVLETSDKDSGDGFEKNLEKINFFTENEDTYSDFLEDFCAVIETNLEQGYFKILSDEDKFLDEYIEEKYDNDLIKNINITKTKKNLSSFIRSNEIIHQDFIFTYITRAKNKKFIYMDELMVFKGSAHLPSVISDIDNESLTEEQKTLLYLFSLSNLNIETILEEKNSLNSLLDLSDAGKRLTKMLENRWSQKKFEVSFQIFNDNFHTFIIDESENLIPLEDRSRGFQWFFSFDLLLAHNTKGEYNNSVILLDEPGLYLHPNAQKDLLKRLEAYSAENTIIYTTHLPFMIDLHKPQNIKIVTEREGKMIITDDLSAGQTEARLVLEAALGMSGSTSYLIGANNLVVEGVDDYWFITKLSAILKQKGEPGLSENIVITPAGGASHAASIATMMIGQQLDVVLLLDSDQAGQDSNNRLVKQWLTKYNNQNTTIIMMGEIFDPPKEEASIEDLFKRDFYLSKVKESCAKQIEEHNINLSRLGKKGQLVKAIESAFQSKDIHFNKGSVAKKINQVLEGPSPVDSIGEETLENARRLIARINAAFAK